MSHTPLSAPPPSGPPQPPPLVLKTLLIGDASTGKTCLRQRFVNDAFSLAYRATIGCDFLSRRWRVERDEEGREEVDLQVWDTAGQERFRSLAPAFYRNSDACVLVYSLASPLPPSQVAASLRTWFLEFATKCPVSEDEDERRKFCWVCVGTKADELDEEGEKRAKEIQDAVDKALEELLPRRKSGRRRKEAEGGKTLVPKVSVEVLPPPGKEGKLKRRRLPRVQIGDRETQLAPSASSALGAPNGSATVQIAASTTDSPSATASTASTASTPPAFELDEPIPDLLVATSPPSAPLHFGRAGAPPAVYEGGPYKEPDGHIMAREDLEDDSMRPDHRNGEAGEEVLEGEPEEEEETDEVTRFMNAGIKHFPRTSAKTGEGVEEVFDYIARRVTAIRAFDSLSEDEHAGTPYKRGRKADTPKDVIKVNERESLTFGQKLKPVSTDGAQQVYDLPVPPHLIFANPRVPPAPLRLPSIGTRFSSRSLDETHFIAAPLTSVTHIAPSALAPPPSTPSTLAHDLLQLLERCEELPEGLVDLLEACVAEGKAALDAGDRQISALASRSGIRSNAAVQPSQILHRSSEHSRSASLSSALSSTSLPSLTSTRSSSISGPSSDPSYYLPRRSLGVVDRLPSCPLRPHPDYPPAFGRPLRFVFETGLESHEAQREGRRYLSDDTPPLRKKDKKAGKRKAKIQETDAEADDDDNAYMPRSAPSEEGTVYTLMGEEFDGEGYELRRSKRVRTAK